MATKTAKSFKEILDMKETPFIKYVVELGKEEEWAEIVTRNTKQKVYPKIQKQQKKTKKNPYPKEGKLTWQADKTKEPAIIEKPITFVEAKTAFAMEVLGLTKKEKGEDINFRTRAAEALAKKRASGK